MEHGNHIGELNSFAAVIDFIVPVAYVGKGQNNIATGLSDRDRGRDSPRCNRAENSESV